MAFLRTTSTRRLILLCVTVVAAAAACTAIALAATSGGPKPPPKPLAVAVHDAVTAPEPRGVTATVSFKNRLIDSANFEGTDPLISGGTGRLWATPDGHVRIEVQSTSGDAQLVSDGKSFWAYDPSSNTVYRGNVPQDNGKQAADKAQQPPTLQRIQQAITKLQGKSSVSGARPTNIGGQPAYDVRVSPKQSGGLFGGTSLAWDAIKRVPLRAAVYARGQSSPVLSLSVTHISFGKVGSSAVNISPPPGAKTVDLTTTSDHGNQTAAPSFNAVAPSSLAGRQKQEVKQLRDGGAVVTYGTGPGTIVVLEKPSDGQTTLAKPQTGDHHQGLQLPTVTIGGATAQELSTPLGTVIRFDRGGVSYTVAGSLPASTVLAAARGL